MNKVIIAVIGCGRIGQMHARNIDLHEKTTLSCVYDVNSEFAEKISREFNFPDHYEFKKDELLKIIDYAKNNNLQVITTEKDFSIEELNARLEAAAKNGLSGILDVNEIPLVSTDFGNDPHSVIYDKSHTRKIDNSTKILAWYDNEWGFSNRMLDVANYLNQLSKKESQAA